MTADPFDLERFVEAQAHNYADALAELRRGRKTTHWMWYVFPQIAGLGASPMSVEYAIGSIEEARAYLKHPVLGPRLRTCVEALLALGERSANAVMGSPDDLKLRSCLTLFAEAAPEEPLFRAALDRYFDGAMDGLTLEVLGRA
jgi:uncharacterized protein (DUF1810 family)